MQRVAATLAPTAAANGSFLALLNNTGGCSAKHAVRGIAACPAVHLHFVDEGVCRNRPRASNVWTSAARAPRAKDHLHMIMPQRFYVHQQSSRGDRHAYAARTRFIPGSILTLFKANVWPISPADEQSRLASAAQVRVDIGARMRSMWR
jgi:hypothetical protein